MMKPGIGTYDRFKMFEKFSAEAGKKQFLIPYFIAAHPGTSDEDMMNLAIWLKKNGFAPTRCRPSTPAPWPRPRPCTTRAQPAQGRPRRAPEGGHRARRKRRRLHKAFLRYHDPTTGRCCARR
jgi:radical SAM superfamily enzyme YgiQ (UPF0313 family)